MATLTLSKKASHVIIFYKSISFFFCLHPAAATFVLIIINIETHKDAHRLIHTLIIHCSTLGKQDKVFSRPMCGLSLAAFFISLCLLSVTQLSPCLRLYVRPCVRPSIHSSVHASDLPTWAYYNDWLYC